MSGCLTRCRRLTKTLPLTNQTQRKEKRITVRCGSPVSYRIPRPHKATHCVHGLNPQTQISITWRVDTVLRKQRGERRSQFGLLSGFRGREEWVRNCGDDNRAQLKFEYRFLNSPSYRKHYCYKMPMHSCGSTIYGSSVDREVIAASHVEETSLHISKR